MRALSLFLLPLFVAPSLVAQSPTSGPGGAPPAIPPRRSVFIDIAGLAGNRPRFGLEPVTLGRWTLGLVVTRVDTGGNPDGQIALPCPVPGCSGTYVTPTYVAWSLDLAVRYYPPLRSRRFMPYLGGFLGYDWRTFRNGVDSYRAGWEPGVEIGLRARALGALFVDVGGWFKLVRLDDPTQNVRPGGIDSRLVAAVGFGW